MKAKSVLLAAVLLAVVALSGCLARTGTGTGTSYIKRADSSAPDTAAASHAAQPSRSVAK